MPGDNPVYGVGTGDADYNNAAQLNGDITGSSGERDFDNPIYGGDMMEEYYAVPDTSPPNLYDTAASPDMLDGEQNYSRIENDPDMGEDGVYYSAVPT